MQSRPRAVYCVDMHIVLFLATFGFFWHMSPNVVKWLFLAPLLGLIFGGSVWCVSAIFNLPTVSLSIESFGIHCAIASVIWLFIMRDWN